MKVGTDGVLLGAWAKVEPAAKRILDIGTGTGLLALMLAQKSSTSSSTTMIDAVEINHSAFLQASENFSASPWANRLKIYPSSIQKFAQIVPYSYDLIISNPPYFHHSHKAKTAARTQARHSDMLSPNELLEAVQKLLQPKGSFKLIMPVTEGLQFQELASEYNFYTHRLMHFKPKPNKTPKRVLMEFRLYEKEGGIEVGELIGRGEDNLHTDAYRQLTTEFYLDKALS
ncbi:MAG: tRNA1(Val) (adenine(37)-N6)-methyltransferase [Chitinophagales bacterium]